METNNLVKIEIPLFIERYKLSDSRRAEYYSMPYPSTQPQLEIAQQKLAKKYRDVKNYHFAYYKEWKEYRLVNLKTATTVIKNVASKGKPYWTTIAGNDVWAKMNEFTRIKMVDQMKASFKPYLLNRREDFKNLVYPVLLSAEIHTTPKLWNWDLSNKWIYTKVFEDLLQDMKLIPNDNIQYITGSGGMRFIPIRSNESRKMIFTLMTDTDSRIINHLLYGNEVLKPYEFDTVEEAVRFSEAMKLNFTKFGESGTLITNLDEFTLTLNVGKRTTVKANKLAGLFRRMYVECINMNTGVIVEKKMYDAFQKHFDELISHGLPIYIYGDRNKGV